MLNILGAIFSGLVIGGSLLAGLITTRGRYGDGFNRAGCLASIVGAIVLIFLGRLVGWS